MSERESMPFDVVIVGGGPAGLSAAIRLKQCNPELSVVLVEKGSEIGAHILSGAVMQPTALAELFPDYKERGAPLETPVSSERFWMLSKKQAFSIPLWLMPREFQNHGNYIISLGNLCRWLAEQAEDLGVEIFPGFAASQVLYHDDGRVKGVVAGEMGLDKDGKPKAHYEAGIELHASYTIFAEGVRGSLSKQVIEKFGLDQHSDPQTYGIGIKELWELDPKEHQQGLVMHTGGWPMDQQTWGGSFIYHLENNQAYVGYVVGLDYKNPHLSPFEEFQRFKTHPKVAPMFKGARRVAYGARAINEGGLQSIPQLAFAGGMLVGCSAGFLNVPKIKGSHNAMKSGMLAAEAIAEALKGASDHAEQASPASPAVLDSYTQEIKSSWVYKELYRARNFRVWFAKLGLFGMAFGGAELKLLGSKAPWTLHNKHKDNDCLKPADSMPKIAYPKPDNQLTFDRNSSVALANTAHDSDQPVHLTLKDSLVPIKHNLALYDAPEQRYCPAGVYEIITDDKGDKALQINAQNCVHCKTCDIKDPSQNITWVTPEGGSGPNYPNM